MRHRASPEFWRSYRALPVGIQRQADRSFDLLKFNPRHPSVRLKQIGEIWSARVGLHYRALGTEDDEGITWFWIGSHADYDKLIP